jgi:aminoglycoside phosphotransferase (APT) family kinase protein
MEQESVSAGQVTLMCRRAFGTAPVAVTELPGGLYNSTYKVDIGQARPVVLRVAPRPELQYRIEHALMRNEHAALPYFAPIATIMPRTLFADWTHEVIGRDYLWQTMLDGVPAIEGIKRYPRERWTEFYRQLGTIARKIHDVRGRRFGPVAGPASARWSEDVRSSFEKIAADLRDAGLDAADVDQVIDIAEAGAAVLDEITEPRLLHGDLWTPNVMLEPDALTITGVLDHDRASWGDPAADWPIFVAEQRPAAAQAFRETYGHEDTEASRWRGLIYRAKHIGTVRLERHRLGKHSKLPASYADMQEVIAELR